jgi:two-component system, response regulator PdtaR
MTQQRVEAAMRSRGKPVARTPGRAEAPAVEPGSVRVLVVEDEWLISIEIEAALLDAGYVVVGVAGDADEAVAMAARLKPDMATMDIRLDGDRSGIDAAHELYQRFGLRCLFISANSAPDLRKRADSARPLGWLTKPFMSGELVQAIDAAALEVRKK